MGTSTLLSFLSLGLIVAATAGAAEKNGSAALPLATATFAGGCFWCMEAFFDKLPGVISVTVGYTGGHLKNPTYEQVSEGVSGHAESVQINYDPRKIGYERLLDVFWHNIDPTTLDRQFCDYGHQYRTAIFYHTEEQKRLAFKSKTDLAKHKTFAGQVMTEIVPAGTFYPAEEYHQHYYRKNPIRYKLYRTSCGRDQRLEELWKKGAGQRGGSSTTKEEQ